MKIGKAHRTQSSSLYSANTIGAPMHPAPIGVADVKKIIGALCLVRIAYWRGGHLSANKLAHRGPPAPIYWRSDVPCDINKCYNSQYAMRGIIEICGPNLSVRLTYFHDNHLLTGHYKQETEILLRKDDGNIKK
jgi:hypothetical protein